LAASWGVETKAEEMAVYSEVCSEAVEARKHPLHPPHPRLARPVD